MSRTCGIHEGIRYAHNIKMDLKAISVLVVKSGFSGENSNGLGFSWKKYTS
jgi:hypothetical protein